jgi:uncharacterized membrane protein YfcA
VPGLEQVLLLCLAAAFAGWVDAVSGGGGLVQLPALLLCCRGVAGRGARHQQAVLGVRDGGLRR